MYVVLTDAPFGESHVFLNRHTENQRGFFKSRFHACFVAPQLLSNLYVGILRWCRYHPKHMQGQELILLFHPTLPEKQPAHSRLPSRPSSSSVLCNNYREAGVGNENLTPQAPNNTH